MKSAHVLVLPLLLYPASRLQAADPSRPAVHSVRLNAQLEGWRASCRESSAEPEAGSESDAASLFKCGIPQPLSQPPAHPTWLEFTVSTDLEPGHADRSAREFVIAPAKEGETRLRGKMTLFAVHPREAAIPPYVQVRVDLTHPVRATCAESVRLAEPLELPPVICAGFTQGAPAFEQLGVTVRFTD